MIRVCFHLATIGRWREILDEMMGVVGRSGLIDRCDLFEFCQVGTDEFYPPPKTKLVSVNSNIQEFEFPTLSHLYNHSHIDGYTLYLHLKGVSKTKEHWYSHGYHYNGFAGVKDLQTLVHHERFWRMYLTHFVVERHEECLEALKDHDLVSVQWRDKPMPHFMGNFWWARNDYLRTLPDPQEFRKGLYRDLMGSERCLAEFWVAHNSPRTKILHNNSMNLYAQAIPPHSYGVGKLY
jgi:hypothetical protein